MHDDPIDEWPIFAVWEDYLANTEFYEPPIIVFNRIEHILQIIPVYVIR